MVAVGAASDPTLKRVVRRHPLLPDDHRVGRRDPNAYLPRCSSPTDRALRAGRHRAIGQVAAACGGRTEDKMKLASKLGAEFMGTYVLVFGGTGAAVLAATFLDPAGQNTGLGIGFVGVSFAFGLTVLTMAYAVGHISGGHFNPAITLGLATAKRFEWRE